MGSTGGNGHGTRDERDRFSLEKCRAVCEAVYGPLGVGGTDA